MELPEAGRYEVKVLVYHNQAYLRNDLFKETRQMYVRWQKESVKFHYMVTHKSGETPIVVETINSQEQFAKQRRSFGYSLLDETAHLFYTDWVSLGMYDFSKGKARVSLSDKGASDDMIIADAVKWVKVD